MNWTSCCTLSDRHTTAPGSATSRSGSPWRLPGISPLRCCLRESAPGERVLLIAYTPPGTRGAYAERTAATTSPSGAADDSSTLPGSCGLNRSCSGCLLFAKLSRSVTYFLGLAPQ